MAGTNTVQTITSKEVAESASSRWWPMSYERNLYNESAANEPLAQVYQYAFQVGRGHNQSEVDPVHDALAAELSMVLQSGYNVNAETWGNLEMLDREVYDGDLSRRTGLDGVRLNPAMLPPDPFGLRSQVWPSQRTGHELPHGIAALSTMARSSESGYKDASAIAREANASSIGRADLANGDREAPLAKAELARVEAASRQAEVPSHGASERKIALSMLNDVPPPSSGASAGLQPV